MAYLGKNLSETYMTIGGASQRVWQYWSSDSIATIVGAGYVTDAGNRRMIVGDIVFAFSGTLNTTGADQVPATHARGTVSEFASQPTFAVLQVASITTGAATLTASALSTSTFVNPTLKGLVAVGTAITDSVGFYGATVTTQPTSANEAAVTVNTITTASTTTTPWGYATSTQANAIGTEVAALATLTNQLRADLVTLGLIKGA